MTAARRRRRRTDHTPPADTGKAPTDTPPAGDRHADRADHDRQEPGK